MNGTQKKHGYVIESVKNIIIAVLFFGVIALSLMYIMILNESRKASGEAVTFDKLYTVQDESDTSILSDIITPQFIGIKESGEAPIGISSGDDTVDELYGKIGIYLYHALGDGAEAYMLDEEKSGEDWIAILTSRNYIYVKYHSPLPHPLIQASGGIVSGSEYTDYTRKGDEVIYINDLFILPVDSENPIISGSVSHEYQLIARASDGRIYIFTPPVDMDADTGLTEDGAEILYSGIDSSIRDITERLADLYKADMRKYHFAGRDETESDMYIDPTSVVMIENIPLKKIAVDENTADIILSYTNKTDAVMKIFSFNPNKPKTYYDESSKSQIYVETHGLLKISQNRILYSAKDGEGIPVSDYIGYNSSGAEGDIYDITAAAQKILKGMINSCSECIGNDASLRMSAVYSNDGKIAIEYSYYYDNVEVVVDGREYGVLIESDGINITLVDFYTLSVSASSASEEKILSYTQSWTAEKYIRGNFDDISSAKIKEMYLIYNASGNTDDELIVPEWYISVFSEFTEEDGFDETDDNEIEEA